MKPKSFLAKSIATLIATTVTLTSVLHALPQGAQVQSGTATFSQSGGALNIQTSDRAIINYQSFSIGGAERVNFIQPSTLSLTLNRVTAPNPSQILGTLTSNGQIVLANPYGIFFGSGAVVNVGSIIAGAGHISNSDFLAGKINFTSLSGDVENRGRITAVTDVGLYGAHVSNHGVITSQKGSVTLAAGSSVFVGEAGGNIFVGTAPAAIPKARVVSKPGVSNTGRIEAPKVSLVAGDMYGMAIAQSGTIISGDITISAGTGGTADVSGTLDASNRAPGKTGGSVKITGEKVALRGAKITASGAAGGGTILVGGDYQGSGATPRAKTTSVDAASKLTADAITSGNGGKVIVWADNATLFSGSISAKGGANGGDGGFIETSGKLHLEISPSAAVDATAANGRGGIWLLDPNDLSITALADLNVTGVTPFTTTNDSARLSTVPAGNLITALNAGTSVVVQTASAGTNLQLGNITVDAAVTWTTGATLTLTASNNITINQPITATAGNGNLTLNASTAATGAITNAAAGVINLGTGTLTANSGTGGISLGNAAVTAGTANFTSTGAVTINNAANAISNVASVASTAGGTVTLQTVSALAIGAGGINAGANAVSLTTTGAALAITQNATGVITAGTLSLATNNGAATLSTATNAVTNLGTVTLGAGALNLVDAGGLTVTGAVLANGGVTLNTSGALAVNNTVNAGANTVSLTTTGAGNAITQTGVITAGTLSLATVDAAATLGATNVVTNLGVVTLGTGALNLVDAGGLTVTGAVGATGGVNLSTSGLLGLNNTVNAGAAGIVSLATTAAASSISQNGSGVITAGTLNLSTTDSGAALATATNVVGAIGTVSLGIGVFFLNDNAAAGLTLPGATITANGGIDVTNTTGNLTTTGTLAVTAGTITLNAPSAGAQILQAAGGVIGASGGISLTTGTAAIAGGNVGGGVGTEIAFAAGQTLVSVTTHGGAVFLTNALGSLSVASVDTTGIPNALGGEVNISTTLAGSILTVGTIVTTGGTAPAASNGLAGGNLTLSSAGALTMGALTTSGSAGVGGGNRNGGNAGTISLTAQVGATMNVNGSINAAGGAGVGGGGNPGTSQSITFNNDVVTGNGLSLSGSTITFNARLSPGDDAVATALAVNGSLTFGAAATLFATLNGTTAGTTFDQITVSGGASVVTLNNAVLTSASPANFNVGDVLRIINTSGGASLAPATQFASGALVTIEGQRFNITYNTAGTDHVTLTRAQSLWIWDGGGGNDNWTTANNWVPNSGNPGSGDVVQFAGVARLTPNYNLPALTTIDSITFNAGAGAFVIGSSTVGLTMGLTNGITNSSGNVQTVNVPLVLAADQAFSATTANLTLGAAATVTGAFGLTLNGPNTVSIGAPISGLTQVTVAGAPIVVTGTGSVSAGTLTLTGTGDVGALATRLPTTVTNLVDNKSGGTAFIGQTGALNLSGTMTLGSSLDLTNTATTTLNGALDAGATGNVTLAGAVTGAGNTITAATLTLNGTGNVGTIGSRLGTSVDSLVVGKTGGDAFINETNGVSVSGSNTGGGLDVLAAAGDITTIGALSTSGNVALTSAAAQVLLGGAVTSTGGAVALRANGALNTGAGLISAPTLLAGDVSLTSDTSTVTIGAGGVTVGNTLTIQIGSGLLFNSTGAITAQNLVVGADLMDFAAATVVPGSIMLAPVTAGRAINVNGVGVGTLDLSQATLTNLASAASLTIGSVPAGAIAIGGSGATTITNAMLNLISGAGVTQSNGFILGSGTGALNIAAGGAVVLNTLSGNALGSVGGSTTAGSFSILRSGAPAGNLTANAITTAGGDIAVRNFSGDLTVAGVLSSGGGNVALISNNNAGSVIALNAAVNAGAGSVHLFSSGGVSQTAVITSANLDATSSLSGDLILTQQNLIGGNVSLNSVAGNASFTAAGGFNVGGNVPPLTVAGLAFGFTPGIRTAAGGIASITAGGNVTQSAGVDDIISTGTLNVARLGAANPVVTLNNAANAVANVGMVALNTGSFTLVNGANLNIAGAGTAGGGYTVSAAGTLTQLVGGTIDTSLSNGTIALTTSGGAANTITLSDVVNAGTGAVNVNASGNVTQTAGTISANAVTLNAGGDVTQPGGNIVANAVTANSGAAGSVALNSATNAFATITGSGGTGGFAVTDSQSLSVAAGGVTTGGGTLALTTTGATSDITVGNALTANGASNVITLTAGRDILLNSTATATGGTVNLLANRNVTENGSGGVAAVNLQAVGTTGAVTLVAGAANNNVATIAGIANGNFSYTDGLSAALTIGTVTTVGVTSTTGIVSILANGGTLTVNNAVQGNGNVTLSSIGNMTIGATVTSTTADVTATATNGALAVNQAVSAAAGTVSLTTTGGAANTITQAGTGVITAATLTLTTANANATLSTATNLVTNLGAVTLGTGALNLLDAGGLTVTGLVAATGGVTLNTSGALVINNPVNAGAGNVSLTTTGGALSTITQNATGVITADTLTLATDNANVTLNTATNLLTNLGSATLGSGALNLLDAGGLTVTGVVGATGGVTLNTSGALTINDAVNAGAGNVSLTTTGAGNAITQNAIGVITADTLTLTTDNANATLNTATNAVANLGAVALGSGAVNLLDAGGLTVTGVVDATGGVTLNTSGTLAINNAVNAGGGNVTLTATIGNITQSGAGVLSGALLSATASTGSVLLDTLANNFATFTANAAGAAQSVRYRDSDAFVITAPGIVVNAATGVVVLQSQNAAGTASGAITQTGEILGAQLAVRAAQPGGSATLTNALNTPFVVAANVAGNFLYTNANPAGLQVGTVDGVLGITTPAAVTLTALQGNLTQTQAIVGPASSLVVTSTLGAVTLTNAGNAFATLSGTSALDFSAVDSIGLTVTPGGVTANGGNVVSLTVNGAGNSLSLTGIVTGGTVNLFANTDITQTAAGGVVAPNLQVVATNGTVNLTAGAGNNNVGTIAGRANGDFRYTDGLSAALAIGTVTTVGVTSTTGLVTVLANAGTLTVSSAVLGNTDVTLTSNGNQTINATVTSTTGDVAGTSTAGALNVNAAVTASSPGGDVALTSVGQLSLAGAVTANAANGRVTLISSGSSIVETAAAGVVSGAQLRALAGTNVDLSLGGHTVGATGFAAVATNGFVAFLNNTALSIDQVGPTNGVSAFGAVFIGVQNGDITQTANGIITAGAGLALFAGSGSVNLNEANLVTGNMSVANAFSNVTLRNTGDINIGTVGPLAVQTGSFTSNGISAGVGGFVSLNSINGVVSQDAAAANRILGGDIRVTTTNQNATLGNLSNQLVSVGTVALGTGRFTLADSTLGLLVNGDVTANGGVNITTTGGALNVTAAPGTVTANAGNIVLRSTDADVLLAGVLTASGLVQLDAGGAGLITQTGGSIAGLSLIARAPGNITLTQVGNEVTNLAGSSAGGTFSYRDATAVAVGTVNDSALAPLVGLTTTNQAITVVGGAGDVAINSALNAGTGTVRLQSATGNITQTAAITAGSLLANALAGSVNLTVATNNVATSVAGLAGGTNGSFRFRNAGAISVDAILGDAIAAAATGITTNNGDVAILTGGTLTLTRTINAANGVLVAAGTSGTVRLQADAGDITQSATGGIVASSLLVNANSAAGGVALATVGAGNEVITLAGNSGTGGFAFLDANDVTIGPVGADGSGATPGLAPFLPIGALTTISTTGPLVLTSPTMLNFSVPLILGGSLVANAPIIDINGGGNPTIQTVGGQTYNGAVVLTDNAVLVDLGAGAIRSLSTVDSDLVTPRALTVNTAGLTEFNGVVGNTRVLLSVATDAPGTVRFNAAGTDLAPTVRTTTFQTYSDAALLVLDTVLSSTLGGNLTFGSTVDSAAGPVRSLRVNSAGNEIFNGVVGGSLALLSLETDGDATLLGGQAQFNMTTPGLVNPAGVNAGSVTVNDTAVFNVGGSTAVNPSVRTTGGAPNAQTYNGAVVLNADTVLNDTASANIVFTSTVNSDSAITPRALEVNTGGDEDFNGRVGNTAALRTLITDASNLGGNVRFNAAGTTGAASVITTGLQTYNDDVRLGADVVLQSTGSGFITFSRTVNSDAPGTPRALEVNTGGDELFQGRVGNAAALRTLITDASNLGGIVRFNASGTTLAPSVITTGLQTYNDDVRLGVDVVLQSTGSGFITFNRTVNSDAAITPRALEVNTGGDEVFNGRVGNAAALRTLITDASNLGGNAQFNAVGATGAASVISTGLQTYNDDVRLGADVVLSSTGSGNIRFNRSVNSDAVLTPRALEVNTGGVTAFGDGGADNVGAVAALRSVVTDVGGSTDFNILGGTNTVRTTAFQTYNDSVRLVQNTVLTSTMGGDVTFTGALDSFDATLRSLVVNTSGATRFGNIDGLAMGVSANADSRRVGGNFALLSLTTDEPAAAVPAAPGNITVFNIAGGSTGVPFVPTIRTANFQTYNDAVTIPVIPASAVIAAGGDVTFSSTVNGPGSLSVFTSAETRFTGNIGQTTSLTSIATDAGGRTFLPAAVRTSGSQNFADPVTLTANTVLASTGAGAINLRSTVNGANRSLTLSTSGTAILGATLSNLASLTPSVGLTTTIGALGTTTNISVPTPLAFTGPVVVQGNVVIATTTAGVSAQTSTSGASLRFDSSVDGPGSLTASAGGNLMFTGNVGFVTALATLTATAPIISLNNTRTSGDLKVDALTTIVSSTDGSDGLVNLTGALYSSLGGNIQFNPTSRSPVSRHATILSNAGNVSISAAGDFFMGREQKLLVNNGSLTVSAGGTATLGDMAALVSMNLTASAVVFQGRQLNGFFNSNRQDGGLGFVSPTIRFNVGSVAFALGSVQTVVFSTRDAIASVRQIAGLSLEIDKDLALQFNKQDLKLGPAPFFLPEVPNVTFGTVQPIASGTRVTEPGQIQVTFVLEIPKVLELPQDTFLSKSDQDILKRMGIYPREATSDENITVSLKRGVFRQPIEGKAEMDDPEYSVVLNRLTNEEVRNIIEAYVAVAGKDPADIDKIATLLDDQVKKFRTEVPTAKGLDGFTKWLQGKRATDKGADELAKNLDELSAVFVQLSQVGLTKKEVAICKAKICLALDKSGLGSDEIATLVEGAPKLPPPAPPQAPRPAVTAPLTPPAGPVDVPPAAGVPVPPAPEPLAPAPEPGAPAPGGAATPPLPSADAPAAPKAQ